MPALKGFHIFLDAYSSGDVILECYQGNRGEFDVVEDLEMLVIGYQVFCLTTNCTINKLVIVRIAKRQLVSITIRLIT